MSELPDNTHFCENIKGVALFPKSACTCGKMWCCFIPCDRESEWEIYGDSGRPDDYTFACSSHVGEMLWDNCKCFTVVPQQESA